MLKIYGVLDNMYNREGSFVKRESYAPVKVGDIVEVKIEAVGEKGDGIAKIKGFVLFIPNAKKDETLKVKVTRVLRRVGFAEIVGPATGEVRENNEDVSEDSEESEEPSYKEDAYEEQAEDSEEF